MDKLNNFLKIITKYKSLIFIIGLAFLIFYNLGGIAFADTGRATTTKSTDSAVFQALNGFFKIAAQILGVMTFLVSFFLRPEWTRGDMIGIGGNDGALKHIWIMVSNVVYFIFALLFVWIAVMNIIGKEGYRLKESIPRFIIGVIMVPFTWFFVQFIISISSILTIGVLSIPYDSFDDTVLKDAKSVNICTKYQINRGSTKKGQFVLECDGEKSSTLDDIINPDKSENLYGIIAIYTFGVMDSESIGRLFEKSIANNVTELMSLGIHFIFNLVFIVVYLILLIALALALFVRGVWLWVYAMLSPVFGLLYYFKKSKEGIGEKNKFSITEFIALAFVPVYVAAALSFGLLFLVTIGDKNIKLNEKYITNEGKTLKSGVFEITIPRSPTVGGGDSATSIANRLFKGLTDGFGKIVLQTFGIVILWMAVMAALKQSQITNNISEPVRSFGSSIGDLASKAPLYTPIIPTGSGGMSVSELGNIGTQTFKTIDTQLGTKGQTVGQGIGGRFVGGDPNVQKLIEIGTQLRQANSQDRKIQGIRDTIGAIKEEGIVPNSTMLRKFAENLNIRAKGKIDTSNMKSAKNITDLAIAIQKYLEELNNVDADLRTNLIGEFGGSRYTHIQEYLKGNMGTGGGPKTAKAPTGGNNVYQVAKPNTTPGYDGVNNELTIKSTADSEYKGDNLTINIRYDDKGNITNIDDVKEMFKASKASNQDIAAVLKNIANDADAKNVKIEDLYKKITGKDLPKP